MSGERMTARITGRVQGVGFRWWVRRQATALELSGWVMNGDDERSVELVAEGPAVSLDELERFLHAGPSGARVEAVTVRRGPASGEFDGFAIVRS
ncbi:MAG TPA: acylphosphatase [Candidatus Binatia bacterium]|nr:acylphosphatase [Candidatus Binatia bacterium]